MFEKIKTVIADNSDDLKDLQGFFGNDEDFNLVGAVSDGASALSLVREHKPDFLLLDMLMPKIDGLGVLEELSGYDSRPKVIIYTSITNPRYVNMAIGCGANYYLIKPCEPAFLKKRAVDMVRSKALKESGEKSELSFYMDIDNGSVVPTAGGGGIDEKLSRLFISIGIPPHMKGYNFLRDAVKIAVSEPESVNAITKTIYPSIAKHYETSSCSVEKGMRTALEYAWNRGRIENFNAYLGTRLYNKNYRPTNVEFRALLAKKIGV